MNQLEPSHLPLMESFHTIQGEGVFTGQSAYFIRLGGCDVGCVWCDVKDSWDASRHPLVSIAEMVSDAKKSGAPIAVVTGGEPAMHPLEKLTTGLKSVRLRTHIETSGACEISGEWDWICLSPKKFKLPVASSFLKANELKVVVYNKSDLDWALEQASKVGPECILLLQPEWSREKEMMPSMVDFIKSHPKWRISLQTHKYMNIP